MTNDTKELADALEAVMRYYTLPADTSPVAERARAALSTIRGQEGDAAAVAPDGFVLVAVKGFEALADALDRADRKGYMPDAIAGAWDALEYRAATPPQTQAGALRAALEEITLVAEGDGWADHGVDTIGRRAVLKARAALAAMQEPTA